MSLSAFSIDISLPFFPLMATGLEAPLSSMPLVVTVFLFFVGVGQLVFGPLSDRLGRKPVMTLGLVLVIIGACVVCFARTFEWVLVGRAIQGFGTSGATVLARAMLRDTFDGRELARRMAIATGIFSVGPIVAPLLGAMFLLLGASWRVVFVAMVVYAAILLGLLQRAPETNTRPDPAATSLYTLWKNLVTVVGHPQSRLFMAVNAIAMISMILIISTMSPIYATQFGIVGAEFAIYFAVHAIGIIIGQYLNHRLIELYGVVPTAIMAAAVMTSAGCMIMIVQLAGGMGPIVMSALITWFAVGFLSVIANTMSMVLQPHGAIAGFTSSLQGACSMIVAAVAGGVLAGLVQHDIVRWSGAIVVISLISAILMISWQRRAVSAPA